MLCYAFLQTNDISTKENNLSEVESCYVNINSLWYDSLCLVHIRFFSLLLPRLRGGYSHIHKRRQFRPYLTKKFVLDTTRDLDSAETRAKQEGVNIPRQLRCREIFARHRTVVEKGYQCRHDSLYSVQGYRYVLATIRSHLEQKGFKNLWISFSLISDPITRVGV